MKPALILLILGVGRLGAQAFSSNTPPYNVSQVGGSAVVTVASGVQKVGVADSAGSAIGSKSLSGASWLDVNLTSGITAGTTAPGEFTFVGGKSNDGTPQYQPIPLGAAGRSVIVEGVSGGTAIPASESGTWTVQPGNTQNTTPWLQQFPASTAAVIATATTTAVKATAGTLRRIIVTTEVASATIKLFDLATASCTGTPSTNPKAVVTLPATISNPFTIEFQQAFANGICALTSGATNLTVIFD